MREILDFTTGKVVALAIAGICALATILRLISAYVDCAAMRKAETNGMIIHPITRRLIISSLRREWVRVVKHVLILFACAIIPVAKFKSSLPCIAVLLLISIGLLLNSLMDHYDQRFALKFRGILPRLPSRKDS